MRSKSSVDTDQTLQVLERTQYRWEERGLEDSNHEPERVHLIVRFRASLSKGENACMDRLQNVLAMPRHFARALTCPIQVHLQTRTGKAEHA